MTDPRVDGVFWAIQTTMDAPRDDEAMRIAESIVQYFDETNWVLEFNPQPQSEHLIIGNGGNS